MMRPDDGGMQALSTFTEHSAGDNVSPRSVTIAETSHEAPPSVDRSHRVPYVRWIVVAYMNCGLTGSSASD